MGHEGNLGIVTEAVIRVRNIPEVKEYASVVFPDFEIGIKFMDEIARQRIWPASMRVVDNNQFRFAVALKEKTDSVLAKLGDAFKKFFLTGIKKMDLNKVCACTIVYEGTVAEVNNQKYHIN